MDPGLRRDDGKKVLHPAAACATGKKKGRFAAALSVRCIWLRIPSSQPSGRYLGNARDPRESAAKYSELTRHRITSFRLLKPGANMAWRRPSSSQYQATICQKITRMAIQPTVNSAVRTKGRPLMWPK